MWAATQWWNLIPNTGKHFYHYLHNVTRQGESEAPLRAVLQIILNTHFNLNETLSQSIHESEGDPLPVVHAYLDSPGLGAPA